MNGAAAARGGVAVAVLASGGGTNLQALIDAFAAPEERIDAVPRVALVVSDRAHAGALDRARSAGIQTGVVPVKGRATADVARDMLALFDRSGIEVVALAGYLRLVPDEVVRRYAGRIVNVHPALLPAFGGGGYYGLRVHQAVLDAGATVSGATVHLVDEEYDTGRILAQWPVPVLADDTAETLAARVLAVEHVLYPAVVEAVAAVVRGGDGGGAPALRVTRAGTTQAAAFALSTAPPTLEQVRSALAIANT